MSQAPQSFVQNVLDLVYSLLQRFAALSLVLFGYFGPFVLGWMAIRLPSITEVAYPEEITAEYMVQMSLSPFPDPDNEVLDTTERLMSPTSKPEPTPEPEPEPETQDQGDTPDAANSESGLRSGTPKKPEPRPQGTKVRNAGGGDSTKGAGTAEGGVRGPADQEGGKGKAQECLPENPDIKPINDKRWRVKRSLVDYYVNHLNKAQQLAFTGWVDQGGERIGFRVRRIRCGNDLHQLGFRNKDVITHVNGTPVTSVKEAISAYMRLRNKNLLEVTIKRRGVERIHTYKLVD
ncbi:MAG: PDZ domain-containing protein [Myxococcota bacterium]|nr:PDZ domain-containing protein [Myxococcota bacterium]